MLTGRGDHRFEDGFTLLELLVSVAVLGILMSAVAAAMAVVLRSTSGTDVRLSESRDEQLAAAYFSGDAQGATTVTTGTKPKCGTDAAAVVEFVGQDFDDDSLAVKTKVVSYVLLATGQLRRYTCEAATDNPGYPLQPDKDDAVARQVADAKAAPCGDPGCVQLTVTERSGGRFTLIGHRRTT